MKVIFLDIDGVLNSTEFYMSGRACNLYEQEGDIDPWLAERVNRICEETGAKIILSSDWRTSWPGCIKRIEKGGLMKGLIIDKTPEHMWIENSEEEFYTRGSEIEDWLSQNPGCENYVILDDRTDILGKQKSHFIHVNSMCGLSEENTKEAIEILGYDKEIS